VDSVVEATALEKSDEGYATKVLGQYLKLDNQDYLNRAWQYYVTNIVPSTPASKPEQFSDAVAALSQKNEAVKSYDLSKLLNNAYADKAASLASASGASAKASA